MSFNGSIGSAAEPKELFTLPENFRPKENIFINYISQGGSPMLLNIAKSTGIVTIYNNSSGAVNDWICRQYIVFLRE